MKTNHIQLRLSPEQKESIRCSAHKAGMTISAWVLGKIFVDSQAKFLVLVQKLKTVQETSDRSYVLNELNAFLADLSKDELLQLIQEYHHVDLNELMDNYVAAMVEQACSKYGMQLPSWLDECPPLGLPYFGTNLASLRLYLLRSSPPPFKKRNIFIDATIGDLV